MQMICTPLVNLARKPAPMANPIQNQTSVPPFWSARQKSSAVRTQKKTLSGSIVIRIAPAAYMGMTRAKISDQRATRSSYRRRARRNSNQPAPLLKITANTRTPKGESPKSLVPSAMAHATSGPLSR